MRVFFSSICFSLFVLLFQECENPADLNPPGDKMGGIITLVDTSLIRGGGYYAVSIFSADSVNPFERIPLMSDSLILTKRDNAVYESMFELSGIPGGGFYVACTWIKYPAETDCVPIVLGTYGCDTLHGCSANTIVYFPNYQGIYRDLYSWTDTSKRMN